MAVKSTKKAPKSAPKNDKNDGKKLEEDFAS